jgi:hypothetical protein
MRFMMLMIPKGYEIATPGTMPDAKAVAAMMKYNKALQEAGVLLTLDGLHPPSMGARVTFEGGKPQVTNGRYAALLRTMKSLKSVKYRSSLISQRMFRKLLPAFQRCKTRPQSLEVLKQVISASPLKRVVD